MSRTRQLARLFAILAAIVAGSTFMSPVAVAAAAVITHPVEGPAIEHPTLHDEPDVDVPDAGCGVVARHFTCGTGNHVLDWLFVAGMGVLFVQLLRRLGR